MKAVLSALEAKEFAPLERRLAPDAALEDLLRAHSRRYVEGIFAAIPARGTIALDADTFLSPGSGRAALRAAGAVAAAVDAVLAGEGKNAFCAVRPPGHHALSQRAMGFCLFNNIVIGALRAHAVHGLTRIAVVDFDVHHGNGTEAAFAAEAGFFYASTHQAPLYPGTGAVEDRGVGNIVNAPLSPSSGGREFREAFRESILPALSAFRPELLLVSAGFDAHRDDPLSGLSLEEADYAWVSEELLQIAARFAGGRIVSVLEGGYDRRALAASAAAHVRVLMTA